MVRTGEPCAERRQPCPCGSGKRYKNCCMDDDPTVHAGVLYAAERAAPGTIIAMIAGLGAEILARTQPKDNP